MSGGGRERNAVKFSVWHFYMHGTNGSQHMDVLKKLRATCSESKAKKPGGGAMQTLEMDKVTKTKVQITWPAPCVFDNVTRVIQKALGPNWKDFVTVPAGTAGTEAPAATAGGAAEGESLEAAVAAALEEAPTSELSRNSERAGLSAPSAAPALGASTSGATDTPDAVHCRSSQGALLSLRLEAITTVYNAKDARKYEDPPCTFEVDWEAELGQGSFGKVYLGTQACPELSDDYVELFAIKMLRDSKEDEAQGFNSDATTAAQEEVRRHVALGLHPNVVRLLDVGLFKKLFKRTPQPRQLQQLAAAASTGAAQRNWTWEAHIGLAFDLYEIDVRQFLQKSDFTQTGIRHVLNSVIAGLGFLHDKGCVHCDLKPANILMRGSTFFRGCFEKEALTFRQIGEWDPVNPTPQSKLEFEYQIPRCFEVLGSITKHVRAQYEL